jgi:hypothetical protein
MRSRIQPLVPPKKKKKLNTELSYDIVILLIDILHNKKDLKTGT